MASLYFGTGTVETLGVAGVNWGKGANPNVLLVGMTLPGAPIVLARVYR